jgi:hypothetical protein
MQIRCQQNEYMNQESNRHRDGLSSSQRKSTQSRATLISPFLMGMLVLSLRPSVQANSNLQRKCLLALSESERTNSAGAEFQSTEWSALISELVHLILRPRLEQSANSEWKQIDIQSLVAQKKAEIERTLGPKAAHQLFSEVQRRVSRRLSEPALDEDTSHRFTDSSQATQPTKVKIFKPIVVQNFEGHSDWVKAGIFSPDGSKVLTTTRDHTLVLWDTLTGK